MRFEKREKKVRQKADSNSGRSRQKACGLLSTATETDVEQVSFFSVDWTNHTLVGGVSVNRHLLLYSFCLLLTHFLQNLAHYVKTLHTSQSDTALGD